MVPIEGEAHVNVAIVGELNPYGADPRYALYHEPRNASGDRLRRILGLSVRSYVPLAKYNLCVGDWMTVAARARAADVMRAHRVIVALGAKVRAAFMYWRGGLWTGQSAPFVASSGDHTFVVLPHPSGLCRAWNEPGVVERARELVKKYAELPCGEVEEFFRAPVRT